MSEKIYIEPVTPIEYKIVITRFEPNPSYDESLANERMERNRRGWGDDPIPDKMIESRKLEITLTEEEYEAIKKAVLETFK